jgi:hypothetical protein
MRSENSNPASLTILGLAGIVALLAYLFENITNVGSAGTALPLLATFFACSVLVSFWLFLKKIFYVRIHLILFFLFIAWFALRVVIDLNDLERLKAITVATTGGIVLFYLAGAFAGLVFHQTFAQSRKIIFFIGLLVAYLGLLIILHMHLDERLREDIFLIDDLDGAYQRPGNFLSISFTVISFMVFALALRRVDGEMSRPMYAFILLLYTAQMFLALVAAQLFGSNSATAVVLGIFLITVTMIFLINNNTLYSRYAHNKTRLLWTSRVFKHLARFLGISVTLVVLLFSIIIWVTDFDLMSIRFFGFGSGVNSSLISRIEILMNTGLDQLAYAPIFGNMNVAYYTTGSSGRTLHTFLPYVMANLGVVGLVMVLALLGFVIRQLMREVAARKTGNFFNDFFLANLALYSICIFMFLLLFANIATGVNWPVLWFALGFVSKPFGFR